MKALHEHCARLQADRVAAGQRWQENGLVFTATIGTPIEPRNLNCGFAALLDRAGLRRVRLHDLRQGATALLRALCLHDELAAVAIGEQPQEDDKLACLECGQWFLFLGKHVSAAHGIKSDAYRRRHHLPPGLPLHGQTVEAARPPERP